MAYGHLKWKFWTCLHWNIIKLITHLTLTVARPLAGVNEEGLERKWQEVVKQAFDQWSNYEHWQLEYKCKFVWVWVCVCARERERENIFFYNCHSELQSWDFHLWSLIIWGCLYLICNINTALLFFQIFTLQSVNVKLCIDLFYLKLRGKPFAGLTIYSLISC